MRHAMLVVLALGGSCTAPRLRVPPPTPRAVVAEPAIAEPTLPDDGTRPVPFPSFPASPSDGDAGGDWYVYARTDGTSVINVRTLDELDLPERFSFDPQVAPSTILLSPDARELLIADDRGSSEGAGMAPGVQSRDVGLSIWDLAGATRIGRVETKLALVMLTSKRDPQVIQWSHGGSFFAFRAADARGNASPHLARAGVWKDEPLPLPDGPAWICDHYDVTPDDRFVLAHCNDRIFVFRVADGARVASLPSLPPYTEDPGAYHLEGDWTLSADGGRFAYVSASGVLATFDVKALRDEGVIKAPCDPWDKTFSTNGRWLGVLGWKKTGGEGEEACVIDVARRAVAAHAEVPSRANVRASVDDDGTLHLTWHDDGDERRRLSPSTRRLAPDAPPKRDALDAWAHVLSPELQPDDRWTKAFLFAPGPQSKDAVAGRLPRPPRDALVYRYPSTSSACTIRGLAGAWAGDAPALMSVVGDHLLAWLRPGVGVYDAASCAPLLVRPPVDGPRTPRIYARPGADWLAVAFGETSVRFVDLRHGTMGGQWQPECKGELSLGVAPGGAVATCTTGAGVAVLSSTSDKPLFRVAGASDPLLDPTGRRVAFVGAGGLEVHEIGSGRLLLSVPGARPTARDCAFSRDGRQFLLGGRGLRVWELDAGTEGASPWVPGDRVPFDHPLVTSDGASVVVHGEQSIVVRDPATGAKRCEGSVPPGRPSLDAVELDATERGVVARDAAGAWWTMPLTCGPLQAARDAGGVLVSGGRPIRALVRGYDVVLLDEASRDELAMLRFVADGARALVFAHGKLDELGGDATIADDVACKIGVHVYPFARCAVAARSPGLLARALK